MTGLLAVAPFMLIGLLWAAHVQALTITFVDPGGPNTTAGHPARAWTAAEKSVVNEALAEWKAGINNFDPIGGNFTLRWEDGDLFKKFNNECDFTGVAATTIRGSGGFAGCPSPPDLSADFPVNEIYFNTGQPWFVDPTPAFDGDDTGEVPDDKLDLLSTAKHELGHALGIFTGGFDGHGHLTDGSGGAMEATLDFGERDRVTALDFALARAQGGDLGRAVVPEPTTLTLVALAALILIGCARRRARWRHDGLGRAVGDAAHCIDSACRANPSSRRTVEIGSKTARSSCPRLRTSPKV